MDTSELAEILPIIAATTLNAIILFAIKAMYIIAEETKKRKLQDPYRVRK
jgi:hypothetical protein